MVRQLCSTRPGACGGWRAARAPLRWRGTASLGCASRPLRYATRPWTLHPRNPLGSGTVDATLDTHRPSPLQGVLRMRCTPACVRAPCSCARVSVRSSDLCTPVVQLRGRQHTPTVRTSAHQGPLRKRCPPRPPESALPPPQTLQDAQPHPQSLKPAGATHTFPDTRPGHDRGLPRHVRKTTVARRDASLELPRDTTCQPRVLTSWATLGAGALKRTAGAAPPCHC